MQPDGPLTIVAGLALVALAYGLLFGAAELLRRHGVAGDATRTLVHAAGGGLALGLPTLFPSPAPVLLAAIGFTILMAASRGFGLLGSIHDVARPTIGAQVYPMGIAAAFALTGGQAPAYPVAILALCLGDPAAAFVGRRAARRYASVWGTPRSLEGSAAAFVVTTTLAAAVLMLTVGPAAPHLVATAIAVGLAVALAEAATPGGLDNLSIPLVAVATLQAAAVTGSLVAVLLAVACTALAGTAWSGTGLAGTAWSGTAVATPVRREGHTT